MTACFEKRNMAALGVRHVYRAVWAAIMGTVVAVACVVFPTAAQAGPTCDPISTNSNSITQVCTAVAAAPAGCYDTTRPTSVEQQRLTNKLTAGNANPFAYDLLVGAGFDQYGPNFIAGLCSKTDYNSAFTYVTNQGLALWQAAVNRAQGRKVTGDPVLVPRGDDRPVYWARLTMTQPLNWWTPSAFTPTADQLTALQLQLEMASRGQLSVSFPAGPQYKRLMMSSFDVFTLPNPGTNGTGMRNGNPSFATALQLHNTRTPLPDGTTLVIQVFVLPVNYPPFMLGMQENVLVPWYLPGPAQLHASISMSQGSGDQFNLEMWNGRFHGPSAGNDNVVLCPTAGNARQPQIDDCDVYPPTNVPNYNLGTGKPWSRDNPPQFTTTSLPIAQMIAAATGAGVPHPPGDTFPPSNLGTIAPTYPDPTGAFGVQWHTNYNVYGSGAVHTICDPNLGTANSVSPSPTATIGVNSPIFAFPPTSAVPPALPPVPPLATDCALDGGGGNYLSNESAYRNTLVRNTLAPNVIAGHIHTPVVTHFSTGDNALITDAQFEAYRNAIVQQGRNLVYAVMRNLGPQPPLTCTVGSVLTPNGTGGVTLSGGAPGNCH